MKGFFELSTPDSHIFPIFFNTVPTSLWLSKEKGHDFMPGVGRWWRDIKIFKIYNSFIDLHVWFWINVCSHNLHQFCTYTYFFRLLGEYVSCHRVSTFRLSCSRWEQERSFWRNLKLRFFCKKFGTSIVRLDSMGECKLWNLFVQFSFWLRTILLQIISGPRLLQREESMNSISS